MSKVKHVLGLSGGKDSSALALYVQETRPDLDVESFFTDTGYELPETNALAIYTVSMAAHLTASKVEGSWNFPRYSRRTETSYPLRGIAGVRWSLS